MKFSCPHCGQHMFIARSDLATFWDQKITCPACEGHIFLRQPKKAGTVPGIEPAPPKTPERRGTVRLTVPPERDEKGASERSGEGASWRELPVRPPSRTLQLPQFWIAVAALFAAAAIVVLCFQGRRGGPPEPRTTIRFIDSNTAIACARDAVVVQTGTTGEVSWVSGAVLTNRNGKCIVYLELDRPGMESASMRERYLCCVALDEDRTYSYDPDTGVVQTRSESPDPAEVREFLSRNGWNQGE